MIFTLSYLYDSDWISFLKNSSSFNLSHAFILTSNEESFKARFSNKSISLMYFIEPFLTSTDGSVNARCFKAALLKLFKKYSRIRGLLSLYAILKTTSRFLICFRANLRICHERSFKAISINCSWLRTCNFPFI